jgi:hypothetical protein
MEPMMNTRIEEALVVQAPRSRMSATRAILLVLLGVLKAFPLEPLS